MDVFDKYSWLLYIIVGSLLFLSARKDLGLPRRNVTRGLLVLNAPWVLTGFGLLRYPGLSSFDLFDLRLGFVAYALIASAVAIWTVLLFWLFARNGAELLASSDGIVAFLRLARNASAIKLVAVACVLGGVLGLVAMIIAATGAAR
jgi:hypothetical protein